jgi:hypothetical protein
LRLWNGQQRTHPNALFVIRGFNTFETNLLTIPSSVLFIIVSQKSAFQVSPTMALLNLKTVCSQNNLTLAWTSKKVKERTLVASIGSWWQLVFLIVLVTIPDSTNKWAKFAILTLFLAYPYCHPILVSMNSMVSWRFCRRRAD